MASSKRSGGAAVGESGKPLGPAGLSLAPPLQTEEQRRQAEELKAFFMANAATDAPTTLRALPSAMPPTVAAPVTPEDRETRDLELVWREIKSFADLLWDGYVDPERIIRSTRHVRGKEPLPAAELAAQAAVLRGDCKNMLRRMFEQGGAEPERAARLGLLMRIDRLAEGRPHPETLAMGAYDDRISDEDLKPALSRAPGAKRSESHETSKAAFVARLLKDKCGVVGKEGRTLSASTIETDWKVARRMQKKQQQ